MMVLIPGIRRALPELPLAAAGSVVDRAGMVAAMALGADGVQLGTRLVATREGGAFFHEGAQKLILAADDTSTMSADTPTRPRVSRPELVEAVLGPRGQAMQMGQAAALIHDIPALSEVFEELFAGGASTRARWPIAWTSSRTAPDAQRPATKAAMARSCQAVRSSRAWKPRCPPPRESNGVTRSSADQSRSV